MTIEFAIMKPRTLITVATILTVCASLAPASILAEHYIGQQQIADREATVHENQMIELDRVGDNDGEGEHHKLPNGEIRSEASIYWQCTTMGNKRCS